MQRLFSFICILFVFFLPSVHANTDPESLVKSTVGQVIQTLRDKKESFKQQPAKLYELVDALVLPNFDFERMSKLVLARSWRDASEMQKQAFVKEFRALIVRTYALSLLNYTDEEVKFLPMRGDPAERKVTIRTEVVKPGDKQVIPIDYQMYLPADKWQVYDVTVDNISLVLNYRQSYADAVRRQGLDTLIADMAKKNTDAKNEATQ